MKVGDDLGWLDRDQVLAFGVERPRVALLNIGSEAKKGNSLTREVADKIAASPVDFVGNIEGNEVFHGDCDVVVCDGFTGNVLIKISEGLAEYVLRTMKHLIGEAVNEDAARSIIGKMQHKVDYNSYGGALLLGANGIVTICHGRSMAPASCSAIRVASEAVGANVNEHIVAMAREASAVPSSGARRSRHTTGRPPRRPVPF